MKNHGALKKYSKKQKTVPVRVSAENDAPKNIFIKIFFNCLSHRKYFFCVRPKYEWHQTGSVITTRQESRQVSDLNIAVPELSLPTYSQY